ncbi:MAG: hypothetical protein ACU836_01575 [Gammaproteobacteria bacterium]
MSSSLLPIGSNIIQSAQNKVADAAQAIAREPVKQQAPGVKGPGDLKSTDYVRPLMELNEAELEAKAGARIIKAEKETLGSLFDKMA